MQSGNLTAPDQNPDGCCAGEAPGNTLNSIQSVEKVDGPKNVARNVKTGNTESMVSKPAEPNSRGRASLEKQHAVVRDVDGSPNRNKDLNFVSYLHPLSNLTMSAKPNSDVKSFSMDALGRKGSEASNMIAISEPAAMISIVSSQLLQTAESLTRGNKGDRAPSAFAPVSPLGFPSESLMKSEKNCMASSGKVAPTRGLSHDAAVNVSCRDSSNARCCDTAVGKALPASGVTFSGNSLSPNHVSAGWPAAASTLAASRSSNFTTEPPGAVAAGAPSQMSSLPGSRIPVSIVSERTKQFERGIARKSAIEMKSRSLDPPYTCDSITSHAPAFERFALGSRPLSAGCPGYTMTSLADEEDVPDDSGKDSDAPPSERVWKKRASQDQFADREMKNHSYGDDSVIDQNVDQNTMPFCTPAAKTGNIQKLKSFFGETTPKIIEARGARCVGEDTTGDSLVDGVHPDSKKESHAKCDAAATAAAQKSLTFDPASWALERMARGKKAAAWTLACRSHSSHAPGNHVRHKKSSTEREPSSSPKQKEHKTWKGKVAETFKRYGSGTAVSESESGQSEEFVGTFGVPLELLPPSLVSEFVPSVVEMCTRVVEEKGLDNQGIYRVPGNTGALNAMIEELNKDPHGLCMDNEKWQDINLVSSMLKMFFRKLPDPLITDELYEAVIAANRIENSERRMLKLKKLIHDLPEHNFETLRFLAQHLNRVSSHEEVNRMDAHNLSIVFGPTLVRPQDDTMVVMLRDMADQCRIVESIIVHCDWFFSSWDEDVYVPVDEETEDATPISGMNQELLAKAERLAFPRLPRDARCKEVVPSFLQAANRMIRSQKKSSKVVVSEQTGNEECPPKRFKRSNNRNSGGGGILRRYLSERKIAARTKSFALRNSRSHGVLREAPVNLIRYPVRTAVVENAGGIENAEASKLCRTLSLECLDSIVSQVHCVGGAKCGRNGRKGFEVSSDS